MGPSVWRHRARYTFAGFGFDQLEHIHVARVDDDAGDGPPYRPGGLEAMEALAFSGLRWWDPAKLAELVDSGGRVLPPWLPAELELYLRVGAPSEPRDLGELPNLF